MTDDYKYAAFISYSSRDSVFARKLRSALEAYLLPPTFGAVQLAGATKPRRVYPVCRDRDELPAGELGPLIQANLRTSASLVVICSPHSAASPWVAKEIEYFASLGRRDRIFTIIPDSAPLISGDGGDPTATFFPRPLEGLAEHLAADARKSKDGFRNALLKIVAGIAGVNLGRLIDRDAEARRRRLARLSAASVAVSAIVVAISTAWFLESRHAAQMAEQRLRSEMRDAFESQDYPRAVSLLAHLREGGGVDADHDRVLAQWLAGYGALAPALSGAPNTFGFEGRQYLKTDAGFVGLPFSTDRVAVTDAEGGVSIAMDSAGQLWESLKLGQAPQRIDLKSDRIPRYDWDSAAILKSGAIVFAGHRQSSYAGGAYPTLLFINTARSRYAILGFESFDTDGVSLAADCSAVAWRGSDSYAESGDATKMGVDFVDSGETDLRFELAGSTGATAASPGAGYVAVARKPSLLASIVGACGDKRAFTPKDLNDADLVGHRTLGLTLPIETSVSPWQRHDADAPEPDPWYAQAYADMRDAVQRLRVDAPAQAAGGDAMQDDEAGGIDLYIANSLDQTVMASPEGYPAVFSWGANGAQFGVASLCVLPGERARCSVTSVHGSAGGFGALGPFIYVQDFAYLSHPLFHLFDVNSARRFPVSFAEVEGLSGPRPEGVALSPDGARLAMILDGRILLVGLDADGKTRIIDWFDAPVAAALPKDEFNTAGVALAFLGEDRIAGVGSNGLAFAIDLNARKELWRFRVAGMTGEAPPAIAISQDGALIAVRGKGIAVVLDSQVGLPLHPALGFYDEDAPRGDDEEPDAPASAAPADTTCGIHANEECVSRAELLRIGKNVANARTAGHRIDVFPEGFAFPAGSETHTYLMAPAPTLDRAALSGVACRTGWAVIKDAAVRFNPLATIPVGGPPVPYADLVACKPAQPVADAAT